VRVGEREEGGEGTGACTLGEDQGGGRLVVGTLGVVASCDVELGEAAVDGLGEEDRGMVERGLLGVETLELVGEHGGLLGGEAGGLRDGVLVRLGQEPLLPLVALFDDAHARLLGGQVLSGDELVGFLPQRFVRGAAASTV